MIIEGYLGRMEKALGIQEIQSRGLESYGLGLEIRM